MRQESLLAVAISNPDILGLLGAVVITAFIYLAVKYLIRQPFWRKSIPRPAGDTVPWTTGDYDPRDEHPVLKKLMAAGWISRYWEDRQDLYAEWTDLGRERMRNWKLHADELGLDSDNQIKVMDFYSRYLIGPSSKA